MNLATSVIDLDKVASWMDERHIGHGPISKVEPIHGGTQNLLVRFERAGSSFVLRRGPEHLRPTSNDSLRREMRILAALDVTAVPHPRLIAACPDETVLGDAVFYLMESVDGFNPMVTLPAAHSSNEKLRHDMGLAAVDALASLGAVDHHAVGLDDIGRPDGFLERQVSRWLNELESYRRYDGYPADQLPSVPLVAKWLETHRPAQSPPGIMHGDYHLANLMYRWDSAQVAAIVDWEMATIGDPLLDLGWLIATWPGDDSIFDAPLAQAGGLPSPATLITRYTETSSRDVSAMTWYVVLACFKLAIVLEGTNARAQVGKAPKEVGDLLHGGALHLLDRAQKWIMAT